MWEQGTSYIVDGMQTGAATLENNIEFLQKVKNRATLWSNIHTTGYLPKEYKNNSKGYMHPDIAAVSIIAKLWKQPKFPSINEWIKKMLCIIYTYMYTRTYTDKMEYYSAIKKNEILSFVIWMERENNMLSEISQPEKDK